MWFTGRKAHSRSDILAAAAKAQAKGKRRKAIAEYQKLLAADPNDYVVHGKVAPLLAETKQLIEAWASFVAAGEGYLQGGFAEKALSIYTQASRYLPREVTVWETIARLQLDRGRRADALKALLDGRRYFRRRSLRPQAIHLLRQACDVEPWHLDATLDLARLLAKTGRRQEAEQLLTGLAERAQGRKLHRVLGALFRMTLNPVTAWRWLRVGVTGTD